MFEALPTNTKISHYLIISKIGASGMGEVFLAEDTKLNRKVAVKLLPAEFCRDAQRLRRFVREARATSRLNHPNICTIHEINDEYNPPFMVMEFVEGETLEQRKSKGENPVSPKRLTLRCKSLTRSPKRTHKTSYTATSSRKTSL